MHKNPIVAGLGLLFLSFPALAQQAPDPSKPLPPASFFVTSVGSGKGADLGGLAGADALCQ